MTAAFPDGWSGDEINLRYADIVVPAGPEWATFTEGEYDVEKDGETFIRYHELEVHPVVSIVAEEKNRANVVTVSDPWVSVDLAEGRRLTAAEAVAVAVALIDAAGRVLDIKAEERKRES